MEIKDMNLKEVEERASELDAILNSDDTSEVNLEEVRSEAEALRDQKEKLLEERKNTIEEIVENTTTEETRTVERKEEKMEKRNLAEVLMSDEYINAYARYMKNEKDDAEVRALLTELVNDGEVPVPTYLAEKINTAWDNEGIIARVRKSYIKGIIKEGFEKSATGAAVHEEGDPNPPAEEILTIGVVTITPYTLKKWISISDEVLDMTGKAFLDYIYDEIEYRLAKKAADDIVAKIKDLPLEPTEESVNAKVLTADVAANTIIKAQALLSDEARTPTIIMNKQTIAEFKGITTLDGYLLANPFDGLDVVANNSLPAYSAAASGEVYAVVGDLDAVRVNFPNGQGVQFKYDDLSLAEKDLVKIVGRLPIGIGIVACDRFVLIKKA